MDDDVLEDYAAVSYVRLMKDCRKLGAALADVADRIVGVLAVARSGWLPATYLSERYDVPLACYEQFAATGEWGGRGDRSTSPPPVCGLVLVVDDSVYKGRQLLIAREALRARPAFEFLFCAVYRSDQELDGSCDVAPVLLRHPRVMEWNFNNHSHMRQWVFDLDGVLCHELLGRNEKELDGTEVYRERMTAARPLYRMGRPLGGIATGRPEGFRKETEAWLDLHGIQYDRLDMYPAQTCRERDAASLRPAEWKGKLFRDVYPDHMLFVESSNRQAAVIAKTSGKCCLAVDEFEIYYPNCKVKT